MTPPRDLDAGLDAGLETYPRHQVALFLAAPWALSVIEPDGILIGALLALPLLWAGWGGRGGASASKNAPP